MTAVIHTTGLRKTFGRHVVLDRLDLDVRQGEIFALLGANGSGKTTTINVLTTLVRADGGTARVAGYNVADDPEQVRRRISLTGQSAAVDDMLTARENITMFARLAGLGSAASRRRATELLQRFDLADAATRKVSTFSGGMRRRLDLALSLVIAPDVLFLDEPTTGLDPLSRRTLWDMIRSLAHGGTTIFLTTQYLEEADQLADRIAVLDAGRIVALGTAAELKARVGGTAVVLLDASGDTIASVPTDGTVAGIRTALDALGDDDGSVDLRSPSLDDVFLTLTGGRSTATAHLKESA